MSRYFSHPAVRREGRFGRGSSRGGRGWNQEQPGSRDRRQKWHPRREEQEGSRPFKAFQERKKITLALKRKLYSETHGVELQIAAAYVANMQRWLIYLKYNCRVNGKELAWMGLTKKP